MAGPLSSAAVLDRVQARPCRPQDDRGFRPPGAEPGAAAAAADPDRGRHSRGRPGRVERVEADAAANACSKRPKSGFGSATSSMAGPSWSQHRQQAACRRRSAGRRAPRAAHAQAPARQLLARRAACRGRSPTPARWPRPKRGSAMPSRAWSSTTIPKAAPLESASSRRPRRPVLPHLRGARRGRREHHRRAHPHHARRHGARQSAGARRTRPGLFRPAVAKPAGAARSRLR